MDEQLMLRATFADKNGGAPYPATALLKDGLLKDGFTLARLDHLVHLLL